MIGPSTAYSGSAAAASSIRSHSSGRTVVSLFRSMIHSAPCARACSMPALLPPAGPLLGSSRRIWHHGNSCSTISLVPSVDPLSTSSGTTPGRIASFSVARHLRVSARPLYVNTTIHRLLLAGSDIEAIQHALGGLLAAHERFVGPDVGPLAVASGVAHADVIEVAVHD